MNCNFRVKKKKYPPIRSSMITDFLTKNNICTVQLDTKYKKKMHRYGDSVPQSKVPE